MGGAAGWSVEGALDGGDGRHTMSACALDQVDGASRVALRHAGESAAGGVVGTRQRWVEVGATMLERVRFMEIFFSYPIHRESPSDRAVVV
jgi:hypothetical protein